MKSNATGFWLTVGLIIVLGLVGTIDAIFRRLSGAANLRRR